MNEQTKYYSVVTFGSPAEAYKPAASYPSLEQARKAADAAKHTGSCTMARVMECDSEEMAKSADISVTRPGERTVYEA